MTVTTVTRKSSLRGNLVLVQVGESSCPACVATKPKFEALSERYPSFRFYNVEASNYLDNTFDDMEEMPTIYFIINGKVRRRLVGYNESKLIRYINRYERKYENQDHIDLDQYRNRTRRRRHRSDRRRRHHNERRRHHYK